MRFYSMISCLLALIFASVSCVDNSSDRNTTAIWLWSSHMKDAPLQEWADKGIGHVLLNEAAFRKYDSTEVYAFAEDCKSHGIVPHVWFQCYQKDRKWMFPVDEQTMTFKQEFFDSMISRAQTYLRGGFEGIHLDYIRFCGNASEYDFPETGMTGVRVVNECCRQMHDAVKALNPDAMLSAALMPEIDSEAKYGQRPSEMAQWLDILIPMIYRYDYYGKNMTLEWVKHMTGWFVDNSNGSEVWVGIQTYSVNEGERTPIPLDPDAILSECNLIKSAGAAGVVLFRHGLGELPDLNEFWD